MLLSLNIYLKLYIVSTGFSAGKYIFYNYNGPVQVKCNLCLIINISLINYGANKIGGLLQES